MCQHIVGTNPKTTKAFGSQSTPLCSARLWDEANSETHTASENAGSDATAHF